MENCKLLPSRELEILRKNNIGLEFADSEGMQRRPPNYYSTPAPPWLRQAQWLHGLNCVIILRSVFTFLVKIGVTLNSG